MGKGGIPVALSVPLLAALLLAGCRAPSLTVPTLLDPLPAQEWAPSDAEAAATEDEDAGYPQFLLGAWAFDGRLEGDAKGAPAEYGMDATAIPGFDFEMRFLSYDEEDGNYSSFGLLFEHFRNSASETVAGGTARTEGALTGAWVVFGFAGEPYAERDPKPVDFRYRMDGMIGLRRGEVMAEVPTGGGGHYRESSTWGELAFGLRAEFSPIRRVFLFARGDLGSYDDLFGSDEEQDGGDTTIGSLSYGFVAGLRIRVLDHLSVEGGWRYLLLDGHDIEDSGNTDHPTAKASWAGPWVGLRLDF